MNRFKPLLIALFLLAISFSPWDITAFTTVFVITVITSSICFFIQLQVEYDFVFKILRWFGVGMASKGQENPVTRIKNINELPRPIAMKLSMFIDAIMRDFIASWYTDLGQNDESFLDEVKSSLEHVCCSGYNRLTRMHTKPVAVKLINMFSEHIRIFNECRIIVNRKYPGISQEDFEKCMSELYETKIDLHIATRSQASELEYLKMLTDTILYVLAPTSLIDCQGGRFILREILAIQLLKMLIDEFTSSSFLNQALIDIFEDPIPLAELRRKWEEACNLNTSGKGDANNSDHERQFSEMSDSDMRMLSSREDVSFPESTDNTEAKFATPEQSSSPSSDESSNEYQTINQVFQQNQLEARQSEPVYGSTSVGFHSDYTQNPSTPNQFGTPLRPELSGNIEIPKTPFMPDPFDSGITSLQPKSFPRSSSVIDIDRRNINRDITISNSWTVCPDRSSTDFKKDSFIGMSTHQDKLHEQLKARATRLSSTAKQMSSCCKTPATSSPPQNNTSNMLYADKLTASISGSVAISLPEGQSLYAADSEDSQYDVLDFKNIKGHSSGEDGKFYSDAPHCPTCIEMRVLGNPHRHHKLVLQKIVSEHVCGLSVPHFFQAEINRSSSSSDSISGKSDASSFGSFENRSDLDLSIATTASSGTLLASYERSIDSDESSMHSFDDKDYHNGRLRSQLSYDIVSLAGHSSENMASVFDDQSIGKGDHYSPDYVIPRRKKKRRNNSISTFKSFVDSYNCEETASQNGLADVNNKKRKEHHIQKVKRLRKIRKGSKRKHGLMGLFRGAAILGKKHNIEDTDDSSGGFEHLPKESHSKVRFEQPANKSKVITDSSGCESEKSFKSQLEDPPNVKYFSPNPKQEGASIARKASSLDNLVSLDNHRHFGSLPGGIDNMYSEAKQWNVLSDNKELLVEEIGAEVDEDVFEDAKPAFGFSSLVGNGSSKSDTSSELHFFANQYSAGELSDSKVDDVNSQNSTSVDKEIPVVQGEVVIHHPSRVPASAWLYPIQMVSIPTHEVAFERGWEPGGNKYTLYLIHYDIRIWPDIYNKTANEICTCAECAKSVAGGSANNEHEGIQERKHSHNKSVVLIREIKRRYREFMYLHNRLTHGPMAEYMKGILRPNRRYAMPFGRMDPDVIEGRRKILEYYLVSIVSRPEVCNSREFKEFLQAEGYGNVSFVKPQGVKPKLILNRQMNRIISGIRTAFPSGSGSGSNKDNLEKSSHLQYFIHGYDIPRMFGYAEELSLDNHSNLWLTHFIKTWLIKNTVPEDETQTNEEENECKNDGFAYGAVEFRQKPKMLRFHPSTKQAPNDTSLNTESNSATSSSRRHENTAIAALFTDDPIIAEAETAGSWLPVSVNSGSSAQWPITDAIFTLCCHALRGYGSFMTFENVQQATLFGVGGLVEWIISDVLEEAVLKERWLKYMTDLYEVIWQDGKLKDPPPPLTQNQQMDLKEETLRRLMDFIPGFVGMTIGQPSYELCCKNLLESVQYKRINRHLLYAALEIILSDFIPEFREGFPAYTSHALSRNQDV